VIDHPHGRAYFVLAGLISSWPGLFRPGWAYFVMAGLDPAISSKTVRGERVPHSLR
jgi:hypothetical protein